MSCEERLDRVEARLDEIQEELDVLWDAVTRESGFMESEFRRVDRGLVILTRAIVGDL